jgi:hypothetical protein
MRRLGVISDGVEVEGTVFVAVRLGELAPVREAQLRFSFPNGNLLRPCLSLGSGVRGYELQPKAINYVPPYILSLPAVRRACSALLGIL